MAKDIIMIQSSKKNILFFFLVLFFLINTPSNLLAEDAIIDVETSVEGTSFEVGDAFFYTISVTWLSSRYQITLKRPQLELINLELLDSGISSEKKQKDTVVEKTQIFTYRLKVLPGRKARIKKHALEYQPFDRLEPGFYALSEVPIQIISSNKTELFTQKIPLAVYIAFPVFLILFFIFLGRT